MLTLADYQKLNQDLIVSGLYDWIFKQDGGVLVRMAIRELKANGAKYNVKTAPAEISYQDPHDDIPETTPTFAQRSAALYLAIIDALLSKFAKATNSFQDTDAAMLKSTVDDFMKGVYKKLILGQTTTIGNSKQPKGILKLIAELESEVTVDLDSLNNSQVIANSATSAALSLAKLDELIDAVEGCNILLMSKMTRRKVNNLMRASGSIVRESRDEFGMFPNSYNDIPIGICEYVPNNLPDGVSSVLSIASYDPSTARASGNDNSIIIAGRIKDENGLCINQAIPITREFIGAHQKKDADIHRFKWYHGYGLYDKFSAGVLIDFNPTE